ncbi:MAG: hypothetical protein PWP31_722 [Clostridia bacterium]|nr:hypothetical protein [Clostridia bacterium]
MLGKKIRELRRERGMSLKDLSEKTSLTSSFLSQVERDLADPSITSLKKIADAMEVPIFYFLLDPEKHSPVVKKEQRKVLRFPQSHVTYELLSPDLNRNMEVIMCHLEPGAINSEEYLTHPGEECIVVLKGVMEVDVGGEIYRVETGDSIYFYSNIPHKLWNAGEEELIFIAAITPPEF